VKICKLSGDWSKLLAATNTSNLLDLLQEPLAVIFAKVSFSMYGRLKGEQILVVNSSSD